MYSNKFQSFVEALLKKNPRERPTAVEAVAMIPGFISKGKEGEDTVAVRPQT